MIRHGFSGTIVDSLAPQAFAEAIGALLLDESRRSVLSDNAAAHAATFTWGATAEKVIGIYETRELIDAAESCEEEEIADSGAAVRRM